MSSQLVHRGPDGHGRHVSSGIGLDFRRLSIIDLDTGNQPLYNEDRSIALVLNGEIYNYVELRRGLQARGHGFSSASDAEVVVHLYEDKGLDFVHCLRGMFGLALWDARRRMLVLARDRLGIKPMYYWTSQRNDLYFASEIKAIIASGKLETAVNPRAVLDVFTQGFVSSPGTMFQDVFQLEPGQLLVYRGGNTTLRRYWDLSFDSSGSGGEPKTDGEWAEKLLAKLRETVNIHLRSDVPVGAWLSPGLDSSAVAALMLEAAEEPVKTYTLIHDAKGGQDESLRCSTLDSLHFGAFESRRIHSGISHIALFPRSIWHRESPTSSTLHISQMLLAKAASSEVKVILSGEGADEDLGGYPWYLLDKLLRPASLLPASVRGMLGRISGLVSRLRWMRRMIDAPREDRSRYRRMIGLDDPSLADRLFSRNFKARLEGCGATWGPGKPGGFSSWHPMQRMQYIETKTRLPDYITHNLDRASMSHSLEVRVPFLDHELVEFCARIPVSLKMKRLSEKYILRRAMESVLPKEIAWRRKCAFAAADRELFAGPLPESIEDKLTRTSLRSTGYFDADHVLGMRDEHKRGVMDHSRPLAAVLGIQIWDDLFLRDFSSQEAT